MVHSTFQPPPSQTHIVCIYCWEGGGGGRRSERRYSRGSPPTFLAIGCGSGFLTVLVGRSSLPFPPWVTRGVQYGGERPATACSMATSPHPPATRGQERGTVSSSSNNSTSTPAHQPVQPAANPSSCHHTASDVQYMCGEGHSSKAGLQDCGWQGGDQSVLQHCSSYTSSSYTSSSYTSSS
jgi:hypothetical protein